MGLLQTDTERRGRLATSLDSTTENEKRKDEETQRQGSDRIRSNPKIHDDNPTGDEERTIYSTSTKGGGGVGTFIIFL